MAGATYSSATGSGSSMIDYKFGVGVSFTTPFGIVADLRYCFGLTDIEKDEFTLLGQNMKNDGSGGHHSVFMLTLGYQFDL